MIRNYLAIALRNIRQHPLYAAINISSLAIGLSACLVIYLFIRDERSFDRFHSKGEQIYRLDEVQTFPGTNAQKVALSMPGMGPFLQKEFPEVATYARFQNRNNQLIANGETRFIIRNVATVDSTFLDIFDFELAHGERSSVLDMPYTMAISESTALKFFDSPAGALNQSLQYRDKEFRITGVFKDVPAHSHLQFDVLVSFTTITSEDKEFNNRWGSNFLNTYLVLHPRADIASMEEKFPAFLSRHMDDPDINNYYKLYLQNLYDVHLGSIDIEHDYNNYRKFNGSYLNVFSVIAIFILLIASVNFMNLTTARAAHRWKEIGVRKTVGARKLQLFHQFILESVLLAAFALVLALLLNLLLLPFLNDLIGRQLSMKVFAREWQPLMLMLGGTFGLGMLTGIYPSFYMTSFNMVRVLKGGSRREGRSLFRNGLVIIQFGLALAMIVSTFIVVHQLNFMKHADLGFEKDNILLVDMNRDANLRFKTIKQELLQHAVIQGVTASGQRLGNNFHQWGFKVKADTGVMNITPSNVNVDFDYLRVYGIQVQDGRGFSEEIETDKGMAFVINESFAKEFGLKDKAVGTRVGYGFYDNDSLGSIIGVVKDFNFNSLHYRINTLVMVVRPDWGYDEMSVKFQAARTGEAIALVKRIWEEQVPEYPFDYSLLDTHFEELYRSDAQMSAVVTMMAALAILISCMGLFGLAAITTEKKTKEIGIRKALGATEAEIALLLARTLGMLILISFVVASPLTWYFLAAWLENFAYRVEINPLFFVGGAALAMVIGLVTISYHTLRAARGNPVNALRYE